MCPDRSSRYLAPYFLSASVNNHTRVINIRAACIRLDSNGGGGGGEERFRKKRVVEEKWRREREREGRVSVIIQRNQLNGEACAHHRWISCPRVFCINYFVGTRSSHYTRKRITIDRNC